jgi:hypothetical protein
MSNSHFMMLLPAACALIGALMANQYMSTPGYKQE